MPSGEIRRIVLFGTGNLASNLGPEMVRKGFRIIEVCDRTPSEGKRLARKVKADYIDSPGKVTTGADLYILAVSDDAIGRTARQVNPGKGILIHMSGTREAGILRKITGRSGVVYPVQTFTRSQTVSFRDVPLCIESSDSETAKLLEGFAGKLSGRIFRVTGRQRKMIHLGAVFANNFPNFMVSVAHELLQKSGLPQEILDPLIRKTTDTMRSADPFGLQTGPAMRGDESVLREHLALLRSWPGYRKIYEIMTENIIQYKKSR